MRDTLDMCAVSSSALHEQLHVGSPDRSLFQPQRELPDD
jgi:hypothetical protein